jgi:hypothetical protein
VTMFLPFSPKMSTKASCTRLAKLGYFCGQTRRQQIAIRPLTLYSEPSAPTAHPSSRYPFLLTIAAIPQADSRAARVPINTASFLKNSRSSSVVSIPKKCVNTPMMVSSSSVGSLARRQLVLWT